MRLHEYTIPSAYVAPDDRISDPDQYLNVHDLQMLIENHNKLMAERVRRPVISQALFDATNSKDPVLFQSITQVLENRTNGALIYSAPIYVTPLRKEMELVVRGGIADGASPDAYLYGVIDGPGEQPQLSTTNRITVTDVAETTYRLTIDVPDSAQQSGTGTFYLYAETPMKTADAKAATAITAVGGTPRAWLEAPLNADYTGFAAYFSDAEIRPRVIKVAQNLGGGPPVSYRIYFDSPWEQTPTAGTTTVAIRDINKIKLWSLCLYEREITDFSEDVYLL